MLLVLVLHPVLQVWKGALLLCDLMIHQLLQRREKGEEEGRPLRPGPWPSCSSSSSSVLELGAGCGLTSVLCARWGEEAAAGRHLLSVAWV